MISRNAPCPCGSGKKYKKCCANNDSTSGSSTSYGHKEDTTTNDDFEYEADYSESTNQALSAEIKSVLGKLSEQQLIQLNRMVIERLKLFHKAKSIVELSKFACGDKVSFEYEGRTRFGTIIRLNQKTATVIADDNVTWKISPGFLRKMETA